MSDNPVVPLTPAQTAAAEARSATHPYIIRVLIAIDQLGDVLADQPNDMTISGSEGMAALKDHGFTGFQARLMCHFLGMIQKNHDAKAVAGDIWRAQNAANIESQSGVVNAK